MKLILVISSLTTGGAERVLSILANEWAAMGWQIILVTTHDDGSEPSYDLSDKVFRLPIMKDQTPKGVVPGNFHRIKALKNLFKKENPDAVISFLNFTNILVLLAGWSMKIPLIISERADPTALPIGQPWHFFRRWTYSRAQTLVNQTETAANWFRPWLNINISVIPNPVTLPMFQPGPPELTLKKHSIIAMGRLLPIKGFHTLINAMALVHQNHPEWQLTILGEGPARPELEELCRSLNLEDVVHLPGKVRHPHDVLKTADIFVMSSETEGFPNALCEAMSVGLPSISTDCPSGPAEIISSGNNGLLVKVGDVQEMTKAITLLIEDPELAQTLGKEGAKIVETYSVKAIMAMWNKLIPSES